MEDDRREEKLELLKQLINEVSNLSELIQLESYILEIINKRD